MELDPITPATDVSVSTFLADRSVPCPSCKYDLRNLTGDVCPECGIKLRLTVGAAESVPKAWIVGVAGLSATLAIPVAVLMVAIYVLFYEMFQYGWYWRRLVRNFFDDGGWVLLAAIAVWAAVLYLWVRSRRFVQSCSPLQRRLLATCSILTLPASLVGYYFILETLF